MKHILLTTAAIVIQISLSGQCVESNKAFCEGEIVNYEVYYNWGFIWVNAGYVEFKVKEGEFRNRPVYHFDSYGTTYKSYDWMFKVRDHYQAYLDKETFRSLWFYQQNYEGGYEADNKYYFDHPKNRAFIYTQNSDRPFKKDTISIPPCTFDVLSLIYYSRTIDFSGLKIGDSVPMKAILDTAVYDLYIRYLGKEDFKTRDDKKYKCIKFSVLLVEGTIFQGGENMFVWVTDDKNRIPVLVESKILVGSVKAYLRNIQGNKNPIDALIKE